ncbi:MAG: sulfatase-like hydrolase/transferase [Deltaproteobacteria bacterium]|nr:sulfatase-like hydrolase/transferase [Deltaproteobacteria bacterium]
MRGVSILVGFLLVALSGCGDSGGSGSSQQPNILFIVMDDVGIDQMASFGYGGDTPPSMPNIDELADRGIRFRNTWSMPACSTSRAVFFESRWPLRTNVKGALGEDDLANSMVSPYEVTVPKLLKAQGYESALFGKFHIALQGNDPYGYAMVHARGWDYFAGWMDPTGDPSSIDTTAGGVAPTGTWKCGFVPGADQGGADSGACYTVDGDCRQLSGGPIAPGRTCRDAGGIFDPNQACTSPRPSYINFSEYNGHYVSPLVYNYPDGSVDQADPAVDPAARQFRASFAADAAIEWINARPKNTPWMATIAFASDHTPLMQPPYDPDLPGSGPEATNLDCTSTTGQRALSNLMIESIDLEVGRVLVETGLARRGRDGRLIYRPEATNTMVVLVGDNGSLGTTVKVPFSIDRSKGTAYQTGVWVPLIVSGPLVKKPDRDVGHMVNFADLFVLFGEMAGIDDVQARVPRPIDGESMLPYLTDPAQKSIRTYNYTEIGVNLQANEAINAPCIISTTCTQIPVSKSVCEDNDGIWWGAGHDAPITDGAPAEGFTYCCQVNQFVVANDLVDEPYNISPLIAYGIRNDHYKIVQNQVNAYVSQEEPCVETSTTEFYAINEDVPYPRLDNADLALPIDDLNAEQQQNFDALSSQLQAILDSVPYCPGDGNIDFKVDQLDLDDWSSFATSGGLSSWYDLNIDGLTNSADQSIIEDNLGLVCESD